MPGKSKGWRYQPILHYQMVGDQEDVCITLAEIWVNEDGTLDSWAENLEHAPRGNDVEDLTGEIVRMYLDAMCWRPVLAEDLRPGMTFERSVSQEVRNKLADFIDGGGSFLKARPL